MIDKRPDPREKLIEIALGLLDKDHPEDLSLREVARRAGLTSGAPAHHFDNKMGLLAACAEVAWRDLCVAMEATDPASSPARGLHDKARAYIEFALARPGPYRLLMSRLFVDKQRFSGLSQWRLRAVQGVIGHIEDANGPTDDPKFAFRRGFAMWSLIHGYVTLILDGALPAEMKDALSPDICRMAVDVALTPEGA